MVSDDPTQLRSTRFSRLPGSRQEIQSLRHSTWQSDEEHYEHHERDRHSVTQSDLPPTLPLKLQENSVRRAEPGEPGRLPPQTERAGSREQERVASRHREKRSEERRVGKECRSRWSPYH